MLVLVAIYFIVALGFFAMYVFPPTLYAQESQERAFKGYRGRPVYLGFLIVVCSVLWPLTMVWVMTAASFDLEWYD